MTALKIGTGMQWPVDAVTQTTVIVGIKGSGKTTTARVVVEELTAAKQQCVVLDPTGVWWGLKSSADGLKPGRPFTVLGGDHADGPLTADAGKLIADLAIDTPARRTDSRTSTAHAPRRRDCSPLRRCDRSSTSGVAIIRRWQRDLEALRGKHLACWCPLDQPCHADVLLDYANRPKR